MNKDAASKLHWRLIVLAQVRPQGFQMPRTGRRACARDSRVTGIERTGIAAGMMKPSPRREVCDSNRAVDRRKHRDFELKVALLLKAKRHEIMERENLELWTQKCYEVFHDELLAEERSIRSRLSLEAADAVDS